MVQAFREVKRHAEYESKNLDQKKEEDRLEKNRLEELLMVK